MYPNALTQGCATCGPYVVSDVKFVGPKCQIYHLHHNKIDLQKKRSPQVKLRNFGENVALKILTPQKPVLTVTTHCFKVYICTNRSEKFSSLKSAVLHKKVAPSLL